MSFKVRRLKEQYREEFKPDGPDEFVEIIDGTVSSDGYGLYLGSNGRKYSIRQEDLEPVQEIDFSEMYEEFKNGKDFWLNFAEDKRVYMSSAVESLVMTQCDDELPGPLCSKDEIPNLIAALLRLYDE